MVTGGAGFIGSCLIRQLNDKGIGDIIVVDNIACTEKWKNLVNKNYAEYIHKNDLEAELDRLSDSVERVIHMGACSATTENDFDYLYRNNVAYSKMLYDFCAWNDIPFIYASSAATYGDGKLGFCDDAYSLKPLNGYGYSKHLFDLWVKAIDPETDRKPPQQVGLKFFNVFGPNEYFKGPMASMAFHGHKQIRDSGKIRLFKSYLSGVPDGEQSRDFIYVKDVCKIIWHFCQSPNLSGVFNVGTGQARSFNDLARALFSAMGEAVDIEYIDMPEHLREKYQYYTCAETEKLRRLGKYDEAFYTLEDSVKDYVNTYLADDYASY